LTILDQVDLAQTLDHGIVELLFSRNRPCVLTLAAHKTSPVNQDWACFVHLVVWWDSVPSAPYSCCLRWVSSIHFFRSR